MVSMKPEDLSALVTAGKGARPYAGVTSRYLHHLREAGRIPAQRDASGAWLFRVGDLLALREAREARRRAMAPARVSESGTTNA